MTKIRRSVALIIGAAFLGVVVANSQPAAAEVTMTPAFTARVKTQCIENQATLNRLHKADAFLRNDRGDLYRTISDKLMVPLNQRLVANQLDGATLISVTADYNTEYKKFYNAYIAYDNALAALLAIDCTKEPVTFYNALVDARTKRTKLNDSDQKLIKLILKYQDKFETFRTDFDKKGDAS